MFTWISSFKVRNSIKVSSITGRNIYNQLLRVAENFFCLCDEFHLLFISEVESVQVQSSIIALNIVGEMVGRRIKKQDIWK